MGLLVLESRHHICEEVQEANEKVHLGPLSIVIADLLANSQHQSVSMCVSWLESEFLSDFS